MEEWQDLNIPLRCWIISHVLRLEQTSSSALRSIFRLFNENSKTLGNKSSALSFKSKIDLLHDLEEITEIEYKHLLKLMEIRNQFVHNPNAISFEEFDKINPDINKHLLRYEGEEADKTQPIETRLKTIFEELCRLVTGKFLAIEIEYTEGMQKEIRKHLNDKIVENLNDIWRSALQKNKERKSEIQTIFPICNDEKEIENFYLNFQIAMNEFTQSELKKIEGEKLKTVFKQKRTLKEIIQNYKKDDHIRTE